MDDDTQAIVVGLGAGLGGFAGLLILICVCWHFACGSWCEKKNTQSNVIINPVKNQRRILTATKVPHKVSTVTPMNSYPALKQSSSNDLASKVKSAHR